MGGRGPVVSAGEARRGRLNVDFRDFAPADLEACLHVFDTNVPDFFTYEERDLFADFLRELPGPYFVLELGEGGVAACGGYAFTEDGARADMCWGMVRRDLHGQQLGRALTELRVEEAKADPRVTELALNTSQHTRGFYERLGFHVIEVVEDGYAPGLDRCEMRMSVEASS